MKMLKRVTSLILLGALIIGSMPKTTAQADNCSAWENRGCQAIGCDTTDKCNWYSSDGTYKVWEHYYRSCLSGTSSYVEFKEEIGSAGCCN